MILFCVFTLGVRITTDTGRLQTAVKHSSCVAASLRRLRILCAASSDCTYVRKNPRLAVRMAVPVILYCIFVPLIVEVLLLIGLDAQVKYVRGVCNVLAKREIIKKTTLVLISTVAVRSVQKLGNTNGDRVCIERPHSLAKPEEIIVQTGKFQFKNRDR